MASKIQKPCRVCGKMFTPCADCENDKTMFRWKRVACSPECAKEYFRRIEESRKLLTPNAKTEVETTSEFISVNNSNMNDAKKMQLRKQNPKKQEKEII